MSFLLGTEKARVEMPFKVVLESTSIGVEDGNRIGIVGLNGDGKSTLLRLLAGEIQPDEGRVVLTSGTRVGMLEQSDSLDDSLSVRRAIFGDIPEYVWASNPKTRSILDGLLFDIGLDVMVGQLSGGQRHRVDMARMLVEDWDVLMLDEPTNHLDMRTITWLASHLKNRWRNGQGALLVVSHDRWFLDEVCNQMWEVHDGQIDMFEGGFSAYIMQRVERQRVAAVTEQRRQNRLRRELAWLSRGARARATKPKFHVAAAQELIADVPELRNPPELKRVAMARIGKDVVELKNVSVEFAASSEERSSPGNNQKEDPLLSSGLDEEVATGLTTGHEKSPADLAPSLEEYKLAEPPDTGKFDEPELKVTKVLESIDWILGPGDRIGIVGGNGAGKTTLLNVVRGKLKPTSGRVKIGATVKFSMLSQRLEGLTEHDGERVREFVGRYGRRRMADGSELSPSKILEDLGFKRDDLNEFIGSLSGGQRRRLALMMVLMEEANVLILDEPGNDLDIDMLAALEDMLDGWPGALLLVTHDRNMMERVTDDQFAIIDGHLRHLPGGIDEFLRLTENDGDDNIGQGKSISGKNSGNPTKYEQEPRKSDAQSSVTVTSKENATNATSVLSNKERQRLVKLVASCEKKMTTMEGRISEAQAVLDATDPTDFQALIDSQSKVDELKSKLSELEAEWLEASEALGA